jgi:hypothetical protein
VYVFLCQVVSARVDRFLDPILFGLGVLDFLDLFVFFWLGVVSLLYFMCTWMYVSYNKKQICLSLLIMKEIGDITYILILSNVSTLANDNFNYLCVF